MQAPLKHIIHNNTFWLSPERVIFWEEEQALITSDLHFGKTGHFRKAGIAVPQHVYKEDLQRLFHQVQYFQPSQLIVVGDLFHSNANKEHDLFRKWRKDHAALQIHLIKGNHDILADNWYEETAIATSKELNIHSFSFVHDPQQASACT
ncbi:MAG TPA: metallophosphoesterase, partial [Chitinophagaceae bacterium]|nr:metallophosphoesterase [Chitinophagaceae bacterium]